MHTNQIELVSSQGHGILDQCQDYTTAYVFYQRTSYCFHVLAVMNKAGIIFI